MGERNPIEIGKDVTSESIKDGLGSNDSEQESAAVDRIGSMPQEEQADLIRFGLDNVTTNVLIRISLLRLGFSTPDAPSFYRLARLEKDPSVRAIVFEEDVFAKMQRPEERVEAFKYGVLDPDKEVRGAALRAFQWLPAEARKVFQQREASDVSPEDFIGKGFK